MRMHSQIRSADIADMEIARLKMSTGMSRHEISRGRVLLSISLSSDEIASPDEPSRLLLFANRALYLPALYEDVRNHFREYIATTASDQQIWLSRPSDGLPFKWSLPIGNYTTQLFSSDRC